MEDVCIVCNRAILVPEEGREEAEGKKVVGEWEEEGPGSHHRREQDDRKNKDSNPSAPTNSRTTTATGRTKVQHYAGSRVRRNASSGRLVAKMTASTAAVKANLRPLTTTTRSNGPAAAAAAAAAAAPTAPAAAPSSPTAAKAASKSSGRSGPGLPSSCAHGDDEEQTPTTPCPDWMAIYCSQECKEEDEIRSRLAFVNLSSDVRQHAIAIAAAAAGGTSSLSTPPTATAGISSHFSASSPARRAVTPALPPTFLPSPPLGHQSEGSEYEWSTSPALGYSSGRRGSTRPALAASFSSMGRRDSDDMEGYTSSNRRYSGGSDSSHLSVGVRPRRYSSRGPKGSTDSLASLAGADIHHHPYHTNEHYHHTHHARPELFHRSTSALSNGLRAMTPIHFDSTSAITHDRDHQQRSSSMRPSLSASSASANNPSGHRSKSAASLKPPAGSSPSAAATMMRSNSDFINNAAHSLSSTLIISPSGNTFRPHSLTRGVGGPGLIHPSKSSATLALSGAHDVRATLSSATEHDDEAANTPYASSAPHLSHHPHPPHHQNRPKSSASVKGAAGSATTTTAHRTHPSTSSIPYLSCSPSSPGSGSMTSARSITSTAPSSSARGEESDEHGTAGPSREHYSKKGRPFHVVDEREKRGDLTAYGLFHQRAPSTPSLTSLHSAALHNASYSRSPPFVTSSRASRLSASYDALGSALGATTTPSGAIKAHIAQKPAAMRSSSATSGLQHATGISSTSASSPFPRRTSFNASVYDETTRPVFPTRTSSLGMKKAVHSHSYLERAVSDDDRVGPNRPRTSSNYAQSSAGEFSPPSPGLLPATLAYAPAHHHHEYGSGRPMYQTLRQASHPTISQLQNEDYALAYQQQQSRPLTVASRSKSRSSFTWDHLPPYVPTYPALDLDKLRRSGHKHSKSGTSLHSVYEDEDGGPQDKSGPMDTGPGQPPADAVRGGPGVDRGQGTIKKRPTGQTGSTKKRLFYFPDDVW